MTKPLDISRTQVAPINPQPISIRGVNVHYGPLHVLKDINLEIQPGELFAFLGPSGCGKTTLLRLIAGFLSASSGSVAVGSTELEGTPPWERDVGMVFQSYALWPHMTVRKNVAFGLEERKLPRSEIDARVDAALALVGMSHLAERRPSQLSGGQQQRVAVARTIAIRPKVLLLDEPLSNLDAKMRVQVRQELRDLQQSLGLTAIFVTHDQEEANTICDRIAVFSEGEIQQVGRPMDLYAKPDNLFVASFLGTANIVEGTLSGEGGTRIFTTAGSVALTVGEKAEVPEGAKLVFRPQHCSLSRNDPTDALLPGVVETIEFLGSSVRYVLKMGSDTILVETPFQSEGQVRAVGAQMEVFLPQDAMLWLNQ
ncbi:MAG: ABC transporter ATP-binding protein [Devosia sp.]|uniref:ABC transporter ATP-binding protein n=1 Tax=Devosia sp. TaxID=1871048 RepID=UPI0024C5C134|nr:ABC transporter ATP-binding protein [Devosia sp.]UYO00530.1 MAG: ABC transporter ATP-binding protein [Devosia sp.]